LGYSADERRMIVEYIMQEDESGMILDGKIEGAPGLKEEDLTVFDTANQCGTGVRYIHYLGHVHMVACSFPLDFRSHFQDSQSAQRSYGRGFF